MKLIKHYDFSNQKNLNRDDFNVKVGEKWHNFELQHYIDSEETLFFDDGLVIKAIKKNGHYKSARIDTKGKFSFKYGKVEAIFKVPKGKGTWPAIWLYPVENKYGFWPKSGEIDIMEHVGRDLDKVFCCLHSELYNHKEGSEYFDEKKVEGFSDDFQKITLVWDEKKISYLLNDEEIATYHKGQDGRDTSPKGWPFDEEFFLIINMAIGGKFGGEVDDSIFPQEFIVKDIKIYQ